MLFSVLFKKIRFFFFFLVHFSAIFAQKGVLPLLPLLRDHHLDYKDAVCCICFRIITISALLARFFFDFCLISLKNGNLYHWFIFLEKKNEKKKLDDTGSHIIVAPEKKSIQKNKNNLDFISFFLFSCIDY